MAGYLGAVALSVASTANEPLFAETDPRPRYWETLTTWGERWGMGTYREPPELKGIIASWKRGAPDARGVFFAGPDDRAD